MRMQPHALPASEAGAPGLASRDPAERAQAVLDFEGDLAELVPLATRDGDAEVRRAAVQRLAEGERPVERAALRAALDDADASVVVEAILALSTLGEPTARPAFERLRTHPDPEVRALAAEGLDALSR
jgi:HEAT repeat protein